MAVLTAYLGLCGSGKSYRAAQHQMSGALLIDESLFDKLPELISALRSGRDCVNTEIAFCQKAKRDELVDYLNKEAPSTCIVWHPIENDFDKANLNCRRSERLVEKPDYDAEAHVRMNEHWHRLYEYPEGVPILKMWPYDEPATEDEDFKTRVREDIKRRAWQRQYNDSLEDGFSEAEAKKRADVMWPGLVAAVTYDALFPDGE